MVGRLSQAVDSVYQGAIQKDAESVHVTLFRILGPLTGGAFGLNVRREFGGHLVGNVVLHAHSTRRDDSIELLPATGDGNGLRTPPIHGWIIHTTGKLGDVLGSGNRSAGQAAWARPLLTANDPLPGLLGDVTAMDARVND